MNLVTSTANPIWHFRRPAGSRRILHVPQALGADPQDEAEKTVLELVKHQLRSGMEPIIITSLTQSEARHEIVHGVRVHRHPESFLCFNTEGADAETEGPAAAVEHSISIPIIQSLMQEPDVRVFHAHTVDRLGGEVLNAARVRHLPFVASVHGRFFSGPPVGNADGAEKKTTSWSSRFASRKMLEEADMVVFSDENEAALARASLGHDRIAHLPVGVDCARFAAGDGEAFRIAHCIPQDAIVIGSISRGDLATDNATLLQAFARVAARHPRLHLLLVGPQTESATSREATIEKYKLADRVHVIPAISSNDVLYVDAYHACNALVAPTQPELAQETVLEAWSASRAVIAFDDGFTTPLVQDGRTGLLIEPGAHDPAAQLAGPLVLLSAFEGLRKHLGEAGHKEVLSTHDWSAINLRQEEIYQLAERHHQEQEKATPEKTETRKAA